MDPPRLVFKTIDLEEHIDVCIAFRRDSFICSFGHDGFFDEAGPDGDHYVARLAQRTPLFPGGYVHAWKGHQIVGQIEMRILDEPRRGYVSLFYLTDQMRGCGAGTQLQDFAMAFMQRHGVDSVQLRVSPSNARALTYYKKHGWRDLGLQPDRDLVHLMERDVPPGIASESQPEGADR